MNKLSNNTYRHYCRYYNMLSFDKQFHFASRLHLWDQDRWATAKLTTLRAEFTHHENVKAALRQVLSGAQTGHALGSKNATALRQPYFERYPMLTTYVLVLFRVTFLQTIYGIDARPKLQALFDTTDLDGLAHALLQDEAAIAFLSTHAINFLYLYYRVVKRDEQAINVGRLLTIGRTAYERNDRIHLQLLIYLYTHCIIGETWFYYRKVPPVSISIYHEMLAELEQVIADHFVDINLDNKFEFLVCARMLAYETNLRNLIYDEAEKSISAEGMYLIDRHNSNPQLKNTSLDASEHRNVLFILSGRSYKPLT